MSSSKPKGAKPSEIPTTAQNDRYAYLRQEAMAPYRGLRQFIYFAFAASGGIGAFIFFLQALAGRNVAQALPNLALQVGLVGLMIILFRLDKPR
ncbi:MAG: DUF3493 domain-containing protein [Prochlorotrichaceae cyanobacterium]|jgi:hypothetical protein